MVTAIGAFALVARATGWAALVTVVLLLRRRTAGTGSGRTQRITRPTLRVVGAIALTLLTISGTLALVDAVATIA